MTKVIDVYGHIGLPRFTTAEAFMAIMDQHRVEHALLSTAQFCPDLFELARAVSIAPQRFRALGLPLGADRSAVRESIEAQLVAGFSGIRIMASAAQQDPELLEIVGRQKKFALVVGFEPWVPYCDLLSDFLDRYPVSFLIGGHFAGPCDPGLLESNSSMSRLFGHDRFAVAFTRQGLMDPAVLVPWAQALVRKLGWGRILWGSEWPVALWRDESYADTMRFIDQFSPSDAERQLFFHDNARRLIFSSPQDGGIKLHPKYDLMPGKVQSVIHLFPKGFHLPEELHQMVMNSYFALGDKRPPKYSEFLRSVIDAGLDKNLATKEI